jgi:AcrR family transcriptional regulator
MTIKDPATQLALVEAAARIVGEEGVSALSARRLAQKLGTSTMAVYTYFGGMEGLSRAVRQEGFDRFAEHLSQVVPDKDAVAELAELGRAYVASALDDPHLYRFMFMERPRDEDADIGLNTFDRVVDAAGRATKSGRLKGRDPIEVARQCWIASHGSISLHLVGMLTETEAIEGLSRLLTDMFVGLGDEPDAASRSVRKATARWTRRLKAQSTASA